MAKPLRKASTGHPETPLFLPLHLRPALRSTNLAARVWSFVPFFIYGETVISTIACVVPRTLVAVSLKAVVAATSTSTKVLSTTLPTP